MNMKNTNRIVYRISRITGKIQKCIFSILNTSYSIRASGFTLLETMVAVTLLSVAIVAPMSLTTQSLASAYYARDQITAFFLAQEAIEVVRNMRDNNILANSQGTSVNLLNNIPINQNFRVDARMNYGSGNTPPLCNSDPGGVCAPLQTDAVTGLYGYNVGWTNTQFTRSVIACFIHSPPPNGTGGCDAVPSDEIKLTATITWRTGQFQQRQVNVSENLYRWVADGSASQ